MLVGSYEAGLELLAYTQPIVGEKPDSAAKLDAFLRSAWAPLPQTMQVSYLRSVRVFRSESADRESERRFYESMYPENYPDRSKLVEELVTKTIEGSAHHQTQYEYYRERVIIDAKDPIQSKSYVESRRRLRGLEGFVADEDFEMAEVRGAQNEDGLRDCFMYNQVAKFASQNISDRAVFPQRSPWLMFSLHDVPKFMIRVATKKSWPLNELVMDDQRLRTIANGGTSGGLKVAWSAGTIDGVEADHFTLNFEGVDLVSVATVEGHPDRILRVECYTKNGSLTERETRGGYGVNGLPTKWRKEKLANGKVTEFDDRTILDIQLNCHVEKTLFEFSVPDGWAVIQTKQGELIRALTADGQPIQPRNHPETQNHTNKKTSLGLWIFLGNAIVAVIFVLARSRHKSVT
ncbi:MAG: hypothetical protein KDA91_03480 [Planctomycetaceae bacterium]|nr:hypothetical protein [Planctomycetaceae bacterium]